MQKVVSRRAARQADRQRHPARHGDQAAPDGRPRQRHAGRLEHLPGLQVLRAVLQAGFKGKCAIVTSYEPNAERHRQGGLRRGRRPRSSASTTSTARCSPTTSTSPPTRRCSKVEQFEKEVKERFIKSPGQMRLLIVVDKLLTGFDAPSATYLYIDKKMQRPRPVPGHLPGQPPRRRRQGLRLHRRLPGPLQLARDRDHRLHLRALDGYEKEDIEGLLDRPHREGPRGPRRGAGEDPRALRAGRAAQEHAAVPALLLRGRAGQRRAAQGQRAEARRALQGRRRRGARLRATSPTR